MNPLLGVRWQPGQNIPLQGQSPTTQSQTSPAQLLSLNLPTRQAPTAVASQQLLQGAGSQGVSGSLQQFLHLLGQMMNRTGQTGGSMASGEEDASDASAAQPLPIQQLLRVQTPGYQAPAESQTQRVNVTGNTPSVPSPRITLGQQAPDEGY